MGDDSDKSGKILLVVAVIALLVAVIALIIGLVSLSGKNGRQDINLSTSGGESGDNSAIKDGSGPNGYDDKIWQLAFEHVGRTAYIDDATGELRGFLVDLATAVCQIAGKNCQLVYDSPQRCWDSTVGGRPQGGEGLMAQYYDACVGWIVTYERPRTFKFTSSFSVPIAAALLVKKGNTAFNWRDLTNQKLGIVDGWAYDEHCIAREKDRITGWDLSVDQIVHYDGRQQLYDGLIANEVDAIFDYYSSWVALDSETEVASDPITSCFKGGQAVMMRKDSRLDEWWNPALASLMASSQWQSICNDISDEHGHFDGPEPDEVCLNY